MQITWFGHSCFRIDAGSSRILIDPFLSGNATFENLTWDALHQNATMQAQWGKLGIDMEGAAAAITKRYDYSFSWLGLILTLAAVGGYFAFLVVQSDNEYRQIIAEKFGNRS